MVNQKVVNQFHATGLSTPPENIRKPEVFSCFQGVSKETSAMKWVNELCFHQTNVKWILDEVSPQTVSVRDTPSLILVELKSEYKK